MSEETTSEKTPKLSNTNNSMISACKTDIKISAEGVAKLNFSFLDEMQGDSSLEPGEVKTPPHGSSATEQDLNSELLDADTDKMLRKESLVKLKKSTSLSDAEVCQEKVRAILELDAIKRKEEVENRKKLKEKAVTNEDALEVEAKKKAKEERRKLKKRLKKEQEEARLALESDDDTSVWKSELLKSMDALNANKGTTLQNETPVRYPGVMPTPRLMSSAYGDGFMPYRPVMTPFIRGMRPEFHNVRGVYHSRPRAPVRGHPRFNTFRPNFFNNAPARHHILPPRQHTPPPVRGHSPILAPDSELHWTKTKPSISYAFNIDKSKTQIMDVNKEVTDLAKETAKRVKKSKKESKVKVKSRKLKKKQGNKKNKRNIEKIRKTLQKAKKKSHQTPEKVQTVSREATNVSTTELLAEIENVVKNIKVEKTDYYPKEIVSCLIPKPITIKKEVIDESYETPKATAAEDDINQKEQLNVTQQNSSPIQISDFDLQKTKTADIVSSTKSNIDDLKAGIDMFADSPPVTPPAASKTKKKVSTDFSTATKTKNPTDRTHCDNSSALESAVIVKSTTPPRELLKKRITASKEKSLATQSKDIEKSVQKSHKQVESKTYNVKEIDKRCSPKNTDVVKDVKDNNVKTAKTREYKNPFKQRSPSPHRSSSRSPSRRGRCSDIGRKRPMNNSSSPNYKSNKSSVHRDQSSDFEKNRKSHARSPRDAGNRYNKRESMHHSTSSRTSLESNMDLKDSKHRSRERLNSSSRKIDVSKSRSPKGSNSKDSTFVSKRLSASSSSIQKLATHRSRSRDSVRRSGDNKKDTNRSLSKESLKAEKDAKRRSTETLNKTSATADTCAGSHDKSKKSKQEEVNSKKVTPIPKTDPKDKNRECVIVDSNRTTNTAKQKTTPLYFIPDEFHSPEDNIDGIVASKSLNKSKSKDKQSESSNKMNKCTASGKRSDDKSPDTDDYMDNWENEDPDTDAISNITGDSSTPIISSQEDIDDKLITRFVNPSPPANILQLQTELKETSKSTTPTSSPPKQNASDIENTASTSIESQTQNKPTGMQEIYDQFIKSVGDSVNHKQLDSKQSENDLKSVNKMHRTDLKEIYTSSSPLFSSASSASSTTSDSSNTSGSSTTSTANNSSEESNDSGNFANDFKLKNYSESSTKLSSTDTEVQKISSPKKSSSSTSYCLETKTCTPPATLREPNSSNAISPSIQQIRNVSTEACSTNTPEATVDFKKLKSIDTNLDRIQKMRANFDSTDELSGELLKMERIFIQERHLILQKYLPKKTMQPIQANTQVQNVAATVTATTTDATLKPPTQTEPLFEACTPNYVSQPPIPNKIFDINRESIKLTISPIKLSKANVIFSKDDNALKRAIESNETDETDFTEKLLKPAKEIAIVKPMMETKPMRTSHQKNNVIASYDRSRSPGRNRNRERERERERERDRDRERDRAKRSISRQSSQRRSRIRSLSPTPPRRFGTSGRRVMQYNRSGNGRRSRSISHSPNRRRRRNLQSRNGSEYKQYSPVSPRSPNSPLYSPVGPSKIRRRSYSRERYSRSPLPFKPPSPPMRRSFSPTTNRRRSSLSPTSGSRRQRSLSRSISPRRPRSPRSPPSFEHRQRDKNNYRRSLSPMQQRFYAQSADTAAYCYDLPADTLDARINHALENTVTGEENNAAGIHTYTNFTNYPHYTGTTYVPIPNNASIYYENQYVPISGSGPVQHTVQTPNQIYSNIPTIDSTSHGRPIPQISTPNYNYYNEYSEQFRVLSQTNSTLKELPKATVAVQKGNVLEIVPSNDPIVCTSDVKIKTEVTSPTDTKTKVKNKPKVVKDSWEQEKTERKSVVDTLRIQRNKTGGMGSILKKDKPEDTLVMPVKPFKRKVVFEDGITPNNDSDDEDHIYVEKKLLRRLCRIYKKTGVKMQLDNRFMIINKDQEESKINPALEKLPPPPPPDTVPEFVEEAKYLRDVSNVKLYYHYDSVMHSMYVSQYADAVPPRLKGNDVKISNVSSPASAPSPIAHINLKKDLLRSSRTERASPKPLSNVKPRESNIQHQIRTKPSPEINQNISVPPPQPVPVINTTASHPHVGKLTGTFQPVPTSQSPPVYRHPFIPPIRFMPMRVNNNFMRLPPVRSPHPPPHLGTPAMHDGIIPVRPHNFNMPQPVVGPPKPGIPPPPPHTLPHANNEQYFPQHNYYNTPPHHYRGPPPNYYMQTPTLPPPPAPRHPSIASNKEGGNIIPTLGH